MIRFLSTRGAMLAAAVCVLGASAACEEDSTPPTTSSPGRLAVMVNATGTSVDNQFTVQLNNGEALSYVSGTPFERELPASVYTVSLSGIAPNCTLQGENDVRAVVYAGQRIVVTFTLTCTTSPVGA
ncbi:hypothetical protein [Longimicrobium sp.]|uniref:hypothetical protein n=1 Tax=Longimicrobium sp. TaxID=2029185 RepID=UPI003B3AEBAC